jgi:tetratricopeptide (TPR) repeat protein
LFYYKAGACFCFHAPAFFILFLPKKNEPSMDINELDIEHLSARLNENPDSPLFARLAEMYLTRRRVGDALALCEKGVMVHPTYAGGQIVLGKCYWELGRVNKARSAFHRALDLAPYNTVVQHLLVTLPDAEEGDAEEERETGETADPVAAETIRADERMPDTAEQVPEPPKTIVGEIEAGQSDEFMGTAGEIEAGRSDEFMGTTVEGEAEQFAEPTQAEAPAFDPFPTFEEYLRLHPVSGTVMTLEEYLKGHPALPALPQAPKQPASDAATDFESLALQLQNAKRMVPADPSVPDAPGTPDTPESDMRTTIVTQTMAEIYVAQKEYQAAIDAYQKLMEKQPEREHAFQQRIDAIRLLAGTA